MMLLDKWRENAERVRQVGRIAVEKARAASVCAYYRDQALGGIIKEMPDGQRLLVDVTGQEDHVRAVFGPRG